MEITVEKRYLLLPVCRHAQTKKIRFMKEGKTVYELKTRLSTAPDFVIPYDISMFEGETFEIRTDPETDYVPEFADSWDDPGLYRENLRPVSHFTAAYGWINDPNGPVYYEGRYHLFFQHNPADSIFGNLHWGHAVSDDLVHWTQLGEALFPDETGLMYSGTAFVDSENVTGLKCNEHDPLLLFYTAAGGDSGLSAGHHYTQRIAYSCDGGITFTKYGLAVDTIVSGNRDPKVVYCDEIGKYVMALYLGSGEFMLLVSDDLLHWEELQRMMLEGDRECPDFFQLIESGEKYWVLTGARDTYVIGKFENGLYVSKKRGTGLMQGVSYAAHSFANMPDGRVIRMCWNRANIPDMPFNGSMCTPQELRLRNTGGEIVLTALPCDEFRSLRGSPKTGNDSLKLPGRSNDILLSVPADRKTVLRLFGLEFLIDPGNGKLTQKDGPDMNVNVRDGSASIRVIQDVHSIEIYSEDGSAFLCTGHICDGLLNTLECPGADILAYPLADIH